MSNVMQPLAITLGNDTLHLGRHLAVRFERTLRIPDDGRPYPLPPNLGSFPLRRVADYADRVPDAWLSAAACSFRCTSARRCG
ncbi:MAG: hypothetical protein ACREX8_19285 [Gammaproteobacteria bacterium]